MAGECTVFLLHNLSKSQEFLDKAEQQTRGWWQTTTQKHGCKKRQILTVGNVKVSLKLPYVVERQTQSNKNQKSLHEGFCPFLRYLGMSEGLTPGVLSTIAQYGAIAGSFEANGERLKILVRERNYILKAHRRRLLRYNEVASRKLPHTEMKVLAWAQPAEGIAFFLPDLTCIALLPAQRRHPKKSGGWVSNKYWQTIGDNNWVFATSQEGKNPMRLRSHTETKIIRHVKVKGDASPYDGNLIYWSTRMGEHRETTTRVATLLKSQKGKCTHCGLYLRESDVRWIMLQ